MSKQEDFQNRALAHLLRERGITADFEQRRGRRRIDVVAEVEGLSVVLEAETGFHRKAQAIKDADARLRQKLATVAFAVCYPDGVTEDNLAEATLTWTVRVKPGEPSGEWSTGGVAQLVQAVLQAPRSLSGADEAAAKLSEGLDEVVQRLNRGVRQALALALDLPATKPRGGRQNDGYFVAAKRGMLAVDYRPVFETGRIALAALSADPDTAQAVSRLAEVVAGISEQVTGLRHDLLGRIFHRVLDTARYDGSFYTSTAFQGASLRPVPPGAGKDKDSRWIDIYEGEFEEEQMAEWIRQAAALPSWGGF